MKKLSRKQALFILPAVVDNEAGEEEKAAFFEFISHNDDVREEYENALLIKQIVSSKFKKKKAPESLKKRISESLSKKEGTSENLDTQAERKVQHSQPGNSTPNSRIIGSASRYLAAAAVILFLSMVTIQLLDRTSPHTAENTYVVENMAAEHFTTIGNENSSLKLRAFSADDAEQYLLEQIGMDVTIPDIEGAQFDGILMADFIDGYQTPLLGYSQPDINETIFIFAFDVDQIDTHQYLVRNKDAVESCINKHDFHVAEIADHHVVSWLWEDNWYAAISNHNGYDLAALIEPLNYSP